jgi:hypothetical protein
MRVVLAPGLALLREAAASDSPRHDCGGGGFSSSSGRLASGWGVLGLDFSAIARMMCRCARSYLTTPFSPFSFCFLLHFLYFFHFSGKWAPGGMMLVGSACQGAGAALDGAGSDATNHAGPDRSCFPFLACFEVTLRAHLQRH